MFSEQFGQFSNPRPYANVKIAGRKISGLLDNGASIICLGSGSLELLESLGFINTPVKYHSKINPVKLYIVPSLSQKLYLGVDFWKKFSIAPEIVSEIGHPMMNQ